MFYNRNISNSKLLLHLASVLIVIIIKVGICQDITSFPMKDHVQDRRSVNTNYNTDKFMESSNGISIDDVELIVHRLKNISMPTSSNITDILLCQRQEFLVNLQYQKGWTEAENIFHKSKKFKIFKNIRPNSIARKVPQEYHIAIIAYTYTIYHPFNKDTREITSWKDVTNYNWKSYFKLLQLAVEFLGSGENLWRDKFKFLYRGVSTHYDLKEGQLLAFQHFISTSASLKIAEKAFQGKTLFEFQGYFSGTAMAVWDHSVIPNEQEVLFSPMQIFRVSSIHVGIHYTRYVLVKHEAEEKQFNILLTTDKQNYRKEETRKANNLWLHEYSNSSLGKHESLYLPFILITLLFTSVY